MRGFYPGFGQAGRRRRSGTKTLGSSKFMSCFTDTTVYKELMPFVTNIRDKHVAQVAFTWRYHLRLWYF